MTHGFPKSARLLNRFEFDAVFSNRVAKSDSCITVLVRENGLATQRLGLVVSRKAGNAVVRNLWKRRLREAFRLQRSRLPDGIDLVVMPRAHKPPEVWQLEKSLVALAAKATRTLKGPRP